MEPPVFTDWDGRPAILLSPLSAIALLTPGSDWIEVDAWDVANTAKVIWTEEQFKSLFASTFGDFHLPDYVHETSQDASRTKTIRS